MGAVIVSAWLVEAKQGVIENMAPVLTRVFTPLFAATLLAFLVASPLAAIGLGHLTNDASARAARSRSGAWMFSAISRRNSPSTLASLSKTPRTATDLLVVEILHAQVGVDVGDRQHPPRDVRSNAKDICEGDLDSLLARDVDAGYARHSLIPASGCASA